MKSALGKNLALLFFSLVIGLALAEIGLRLAGISYPKFHRFDAVSGGSLNPNTEGWFTSEGKAFVRINSEGWRDQLHTVSKPPNTFRIAVIGDSYVAAMQVPQEQTFWALTQKQLGKCAALRGKTPEVLAFGMDGAGTGDELLTYRRHVRKYVPDMVLVAFLTGNDLINNSDKLEADKMRPFFHLQQGNLVEDDSFRETSYFRSRSGGILNAVADFLGRLRLMEVARKAYYTWDDQHDGRPKPAATASRAAALFDEAGLLKDAYLPPTKSEWIESWDVTEALLKQFNQEVKENGARFQVVTLSNGAQVYPDPVLRREFQTEFGIADLFYPDRRISAIGQQAGFLVHNLAPDMQRYAEQHHVFLHGFANTKWGVGHWNEQGHRVASAIVSRQVCDSLAPDHINLARQ